MKNYKVIVKEDLSRLRNSKRELKDIFEISFSHENMAAYEQLVNFEIQKVTYVQLKEKIEQFASFLTSNYAPKKDEYIGIDLANSPNFIIAFYGSLMAGYAPYLINSYYPLNLRISLLNRLGINKVITLNDQYDAFIKIDMNSNSVRNFKEKIVFNNWANKFAISSTLTGLEAKIAIYDGDSIASEILNSDKIIAQNPWFMKDYHKTIKVAAILPFFHIFGIMVSFFWFTFFGRTIVFFNDLSSENVRATIIRHGITHIFAPPLLFNKLYEGIKKGVQQAGEVKSIKFKKAINIIEKVGNIFPNLSFYLSKLLLKEVRLEAFGESPRFLISGGSYIDKEVLRTINAIGYPLFNGYGTTETSITGANLSLKFSKRINGSIGNPFLSVTYLLEDDGNLIISGNSLAKEIIYLNGNKQKVTNFSTNDIVIIKDGNYFIKGRKSDLYIGENGENISPDMIEQELSFSFAKSFSIIDLNNKLTLIIQFSKETSSFLIKQEIKSIKEQLAKIAYGNSITSIMITYDNISNPSAIKVSRAQLIKAINENQINIFSINSLKEEETIEYDDYIIETLKKLFLDSLEEKVDINPNSDYFIDLGGDSFGYISLLVSIEQTFNIHINLEKDYSLRTPYSFYKKIVGKK